MKIPITADRFYTFPDKITNRQFLVADLQMVMKLSENKIDFANLAEVQGMIQWMVGFLEVLGTPLMDEPFEDLVAAMRHENFSLWMKGLFGHFQ